MRKAHKLVVVLALLLAASLLSAASAGRSGRPEDGKAWFKLVVDFDARLFEYEVECGGSSARARADLHVYRGWGVRDTTDETIVDTGWYDARDLWSVPLIQKIAQTAKLREIEETAKTSPGSGILGVPIEQLVMTVTVDGRTTKITDWEAFDHPALKKYKADWLRGVRKVVSVLRSDPRIARSQCIEVLWHFDGSYIPAWEGTWHCPAPRSWGLVCRITTEYKAYGFQVWDGGGSPAVITSVSTRPVGGGPWEQSEEMVYDGPSVWSPAVIHQIGLDSRVLNFEQRIGLWHVVEPSVASNGILGLGRGSQRSVTPNGIVTLIVGELGENMDEAEAEVSDADLTKYGLWNVYGRDWAAAIAELVRVMRTDPRLLKSQWAGGLEYLEQVYLPAISRAPSQPPFLPGEDVRL